MTAGHLKWVSMMLPEHVKLLREYNESLDKAVKPVLDEQKYEEFYEIICRWNFQYLKAQFLSFEFEKLGVGFLTQSNFVVHSQYELIEKYARIDSESAFEPISKQPTVSGI